MTLGWLDIEEIALSLHEAHPRTDPLTLRFTALRALVEALPGFIPDAEHPVNEKILESIQVAWHEERQGIQKDED